MELSPEQNQGLSLVLGTHPSRKQRAIGVAVVVCVILYYFFGSAPNDFPVGKIVRVESGVSASGVSLLLGEEKVVRAPSVLRAILFFTGQESSVVAGDYVLSGKEGVFKIAYRLTTGEFDLTPIRVTIPEGTTTFNIPKFFEKNFYNFDSAKFLKLTEGKEGYLFPDTYLIFPNATAGEIAQTMGDNFNKKIKEREKDIAASGKNLHDIIIMASIIEHEAGKTEDRRIVSGILWKRLYINMPLQVDAPFAYVSDKSTYELTAKDLQMDSPYNTYKHTDLPPGAINNPGMDAILAAIYPEKSPYLYYLSDRKGNIYYASTFDEHKKNKTLYIK